MFGFLFGTVCLVLLFHHLRRYGYAGYGGWGYGPPRFGRWRSYGWRGGGFRHGAMRHVMERLDTTPGQERAIRQALDTLRYNLADARDEVRSLGRDLALVVGGDELDEQALTGAIAKQDAFVTRARGEIISAIRTVHQTLDGRQRRELAEWINEGSYRMRRHDW